MFRLGESSPTIHIQTRTIFDYNPFFLERAALFPSDIQVCACDIPTQVGWPQRTRLASEPTSRLPSAAYYKCRQMPLPIRSPNWGFDGIGNQTNQTSDMLSVATLARLRIKHARYRDQTPLPTMWLDAAPGRSATTSKNILVSVS